MSLWRTPATEVAKSGLLSGSMNSNSMGMKPVAWEPVLQVLGTWYLKPSGVMLWSEK